MLYGVDAVHGHNNLWGAVIFPHNIGLGAAGDPELVWRIGRATAKELFATGVNWNFAPTIAVPQDLRWGRTYEGYSQDSDLVSRLGSAYIQGLQGERLSDALSVLANPKHFLGMVGQPGEPRACSSQSRQDLPSAEKAAYSRSRLIKGIPAWMKRRCEDGGLKPYRATLQAGAQIVMASFSSWNGEKLHAHHYLLTGVLKGELGFTGFVVSDWAGIDQIAGDYYQAVVICD